MKNNPNDTKLMSLLVQKQKVTLKEAIEFLEISEATARRLFTRLEQKGKLIRTHGAVKLTPAAETDYLFEELAGVQTGEKSRIGDYAAATVENGDIIYLDSGTTLLCMARALATRLDQKELDNIEVFTNSLANLKMLSPLCSVTLIGGLYREKRRDFCGYMAEKTLLHVRFDKGYLGADAIDKTNIMATDVDTARLAELAAARSDRVYLLADAAKFFKRSFMAYAPIELPDEYITDKGATLEVMMYFTEKSKKITYV